MKKCTKCGIDKELEFLEISKNRKLEIENYKTAENWLSVERNLGKRLFRGRKNKLAKCVLFF